MLTLYLYIYRWADRLQLEILCAVLDAKWSSAWLFSNSYAHIDINMHHHELLLRISDYDSTAFSMFTTLCMKLVRISEVLFLLITSEDSILLYLWTALVFYYSI